MEPKNSVQSRFLHIFLTLFFLLIAVLFVSSKPARVNAQLSCTGAVYDCTGQPYGTWCMYGGSFCGGADYCCGTSVCNNLWVCDGAGNCNTTGPQHTHNSCTGNTACSGASCVPCIFQYSNCSGGSGSSGGCGGSYYEAYLCGSTWDYRYNATYNYTCNSCSYCAPGSGTCPLPTPTPTPNPCAGVSCTTPPNQCYNSIGTCVPSGSTYSCSYTYKTAGSACSDGNACTTGDTCNGVGTCNSGTATVCTSGNQCVNAGTCNPATGICGAGTNKPAGTACNDGNACTTGDVCNGLGTCSGTPITCNGGNQCQNNPGTCSGGVCSYTNKVNGTVCNDGNACTTGDVCSNGICVGPTSTCAAAGANCGTVSGCSCGTCTLPQTCGGGGVPNVCGSGATILGTVFNDLNDNGVLDAGEPGLSGAVVTLSASGFTTQTSPATGASGGYSFPNLTLATNYTDNVTTIPVGYHMSAKDTNPKTVIVNPATGAYTANFAVRQDPATCTDLTSNPTTVDSNGTTNLTANNCTGVTTYTWPPPSCGSDTNANTNTSTYTAPAVCTPTTCTASVQVSNTSGVVNTYSTGANIVKVNPYVTLTGNVYADTGADKCQPGTRTAVSASTVTVVDGATSAGNGNTNASGSYTVSDRVDPCNINRYAFLSNTGVYDKVVGIVFDGAAGGFVRDANLTGFQYKLPGNTNNHSLDWCISSMTPWYQTTTGDVRMSSQLKNSVPATKYGALDALYPGIFFSSNNDAVFKNGSSTSSTKGWIVNNEFSYQSNTENIYGTAAYTYYLSRATHTNTPINSTGCVSGASTCTLAAGLDTGVYKIKAPTAGEVTLNYTHKANTHVVFLIDGDVRITSNIKVPSSADNLLIVATNGNLTFDKNLGETTVTSTNTNVEGIFTAEKNIVLESLDPLTQCGSSIPDKRLNVGGVLVANAFKPFSKSGVGGKIVNNRSLCGGDMLNPTYMVQQRLDFITRIADFYKIPVTKWKEVNP